VLSLRQGTWKLIEKGKGPARNAATNTDLGNHDSPQLYDLKSDIGETTNVADTHPDKVSEMLSILEAIRGAK
jgi:hypothetical protein